MANANILQMNFTVMKMKVLVIFYFIITKKLEICIFLQNVKIIWIAYQSCSICPRGTVTKSVNALRAENKRYSCNNT